MPSGTTWSASAFVWEDGSGSPDVHPSGQAYNGPGYSHWGFTPGSPPSVTPNNLGGDQFCAVAISTDYAFSYYVGPATTSGRETTSNYIRESDSTRNLWGWNDGTCTSTYRYICEYQCKQWSAARRRAKPMASFLCCAASWGALAGCSRHVRLGSSWIGRHMRVLRGHFWSEAAVAVIPAAARLLLTCTCLAPVLPQWSPAQSFPQRRHCHQRPHHLPQVSVLHTWLLASVAAV